MKTALITLAIIFGVGALVALMLGAISFFIWLSDGAAWGPIGFLIMLFGPFAYLAAREITKC